MQNSHSISITASIRRQIPQSLMTEVRGLDLLLVGEITEEGPNGAKVVKVKGSITVSGIVGSSFFGDKVISCIKEKSGGRHVVDKMTIKKM